MTQQSYRTEDVATRGEVAVVAAGPTAGTAPVRRLPVGIALAVLAVVGAAALLPLRTPAPRSTSAPATSFSAERALVHLGHIAAAPHPTGSAAEAQVRTYLLDRLGGLGLRPRLIGGVTQSPTEATTLGTVSDIYARIPGTRPTGTVLLVAHYDSVPTGPGAADGGAGVAAVLELVRALRAGPAPRNNVDVLLTNGEEEGMLGAKAFVDAGVYPDLSDVVAIDLNARGVSGPVVMFEVAGTGLTPAIRSAGAVTTSAAGGVYKILQNGTDLTELTNAGMRGLNFAFFGDASRYHTSHDDVASVSSRSVQDLGDAVLAATLGLAGGDLRARGAEDTYFDVFGALVSYPVGLVLPLAAVAVIGFVALLWWGRRRGLSPGRVGRAALIFPLALVVPLVIGIAGWWALVLLQPTAPVSYYGLLPHLAPYVLAEVALLLVAVVAGYRWARRRAGAVDVAVAVIGWFSLLGVVLAVLAPSTAYLLTCPALFGVVATAVALSITRADSLSPAVTLSAVAVPALVLMLPVCVLLVPGLGLGLSGYMLVVAALLATAVAGAAELLPRRRAITAALLVVALAAVTTFAVTALVDKPSAGAPRAVSLGYLLDADAGQAYWVSHGTERQPVVGAKLTGDPRRFDDLAPMMDAQRMSDGPAPVTTATAGPRADGATASEQDGVRSVRVRLRAPAGAWQLGVFVNTTDHHVVDATVAGIHLPTEANFPSAAGGWHWGFLYMAVPADGVAVVLRVKGDGPVPVRLVSMTGGLPADVDAPSLPPELHWSRFPSASGQSFVTRTFQL